MLDPAPGVESMPDLEVRTFGNGTPTDVPCADAVVDCEVSVLGPAPDVEGRPDFKARESGSGFLCVDDIPDFEGSMLCPAPGAAGRLDFEGRIFGNSFPCADPLVDCEGGMLAPAPWVEGTHCADGVLGCGVSELRPAPDIEVRLDPGENGFGDGAPPLGVAVEARVRVCRFIGFENCSSVFGGATVSMIEFKAASG